MTHIKSNVLIGFLLLMTWGIASADNLKGEHSHIQVKEKKVQGPPKGSSIQATIDGHYLTVVFLENLGSTLQGFLQSGKLTNPTDLDYIFNKAKTL